MDFKDYSYLKPNDVFYAGSEEKFGLTINGIRYMVKFQKFKEGYGLLNNHISEYIGSNIFALLGFDVHSTMLGMYNGRNIVLCQDFIREGEEFVPFNAVGESSLEREKESFQYTYDDIVEMFYSNSKLVSPEETTKIFWQMFIVDAFLGNFDRHGFNWGFIKKNNRYKVAPIFDNGSSLFPRRTTDELLREVMENEEMLEKMTYTYPTSQVKLNGRKSSYYNVISSLEFEECNNALSEVYSRIDMRKIILFIDSLSFLDDLQRDFYKLILEFRYEKIIKNPYLKLRGDK